MFEKKAEARLGQIVIPGETASSLPLLSTAITGEIIAPLSSITVTQQFFNPLTKPAELEYLIPLPHESAINKFEFHCGDRTVIAKVADRDQAQKKFEDSMDEGFQAGLVEERRPNLFSIRLANVLPGENITTVLQYRDQMKFIDDHWEFVYPMGLTPRYGSPEHPEENQGVQSPVALPGEPIGPVTLSLDIASCISVNDISSPSHLLTVKTKKDHHYLIELVGPAIPDHDFVLRLPVKTTTTALTAWQAVSEDESHILVTVIPPTTQESTPEPTPRHFLFVLDRSGSMSGEPIAQARNALRACLRTLNPIDTFNILFFDHELEWYAPEPVTVNQPSIDAVDLYLNQVDARGGTEILSALQAALQEHVRGEQTKYILFLTDGAVSAELRVLREVAKSLGNTRIFTMGIGPSVNRYLLSNLAELGRGAADFLQSDENIEEAILRFQDRVSFPVLTNFQVHCEGAQLLDMTPAILPDLFIGQPVTFLARTRSKKLQKIHINAYSPAGNLNLDVDLQDATSQRDIISRAWAASFTQKLISKMEMGEDETVNKKKALALALQYSLITPLTSLLAVDSQRVTEGGMPTRINIAQPLPQNLTFGRSFLSAKMVRMPAAMPSSTNFNKNLFCMSDSQMDFAKIIPQLGEQQDDMREMKDLKWLARTQMVNGSWNNDVECTSAALLAFFAAGATPSLGIFRRQIQKALSWLDQNPGSGFSEWLRCYVIQRARQLTPNLAVKPVDQTLLPNPISQPEKILDRLMKGEKHTGMLPDRVDSLDDLRSLALTGSQSTPVFGQLSDSLITEIWRLVLVNKP